VTTKELEDQVSSQLTAVILKRAPMGLLMLICAWNLWTQRASMTNVTYFSDLVLHNQMVRFATQSLLHFHWPFTQWYSLLNLGSPQFLHYQGLGATIVGFVGVFIGSNLAFRLSLYLLWSLWPIAIYSSSRIFGMNRYAAVASALAASFLSSAVHLGYEAKAYEWFGYGVWAQLCASWALPFAWAWSWRSIKDPRHMWKAVLFIALTASLHYETGYSAFGAILVFPFVVPSSLRNRLRNSVVILFSSIAAAAWVIVPLLIYSKWAAINTSQSNSPLARGYGAVENLKWLIRGEYFDTGRLPILSILLAIGVIAAVVRWIKDPLGRAFVALLVIFFFLSWGPATWGALTDVIPGHADIFFRRFIIPVDLSALFLIGFGISWLGDISAKLIEHVILKRHHGDPKHTNLTFPASITTTVLAALMLALVIPSSFENQGHDAHNVSLQLQAQKEQVAYISPIISYLKAADDGRVYAGLPSNWGINFRVGVGPVFMYLADNDVDQISTTGWAASLMEIPEINFNQYDLSDYEIMGARYLLMPKGMRPPIPAQLLIASGPYQLWQIPIVGYFSVVLPEGTIDENKVTVGKQAGPIMGAHYFEQYVDFRVNFGTSSLKVTQPTHRPIAPIGTVVSENINLTNGEATGTFNMRRSGNVVLSASYDPGWQAFVDGKQVQTQMLAPALVSVPVPAGFHTVTFRYQGFRWYLPLFIIGITGILFSFDLGRKKRWWPWIPFARHGTNKEPPDDETEAFGAEFDPQNRLVDDDPIL
jgi:hypothetical protein